MTNLMNCNGIYFTPFELKEAQSSLGGGVYMFCRKDYLGNINILYIGETENFSSRLGDSHEHWTKALALGMNEIHIHYVSGTKSERLKIETFLRNTVMPPLNRQGSSGLFGLASI